MIVVMSLDCRELLTFSRLQLQLVKNVRSGTVSYTIYGTPINEKEVVWGNGPKICEPYQTEIEAMTALTGFAISKDPLYFVNKHKDRTDIK